MPSRTNESSIDDVIEGSDEDRKIERLRALLRIVTRNRYAIEILDALERGDKLKASSLASESGRAGVGIDELKAACRAMKR